MKQLYLKAINIIIAFIMTISTITAQGNPLAVEQKCDPSCLDLTITGGYANYDVEWQKFDKVTGTFVIVAGWPKSGLTGSDGQEDLCNYDADKYKVIVHDALCGVAEQEQKVDLCKCFQVFTESQSNVSNCGGWEYSEQYQNPPFESCDGTITIGVSGASSGNTFSWSNGATTQTISNLCTGSYTVTVTNANGCSQTKSYEICCCNNSTYPTLSGYSECGFENYTIDEDLGAPTTANGSDGYIHLNVSPQSSNYVYKWSGPNGFESKSKDLNNIKIGTYCITVTNGCNPINRCYTLKDCSLYNLTPTITTTPTCGSLSYGKITIDIANGYPPYKYLWQDGNTTKTISHLSAGPIYCVTITDNSGCKLSLCTDVGSNGILWNDIYTCATKHYCNTDLINITPGNIVPVFTGCRTVEETCNLNGNVVFSYPVPYLYETVDINNCIKYGRCPFNGNLELIKTGNLKYEYVYVQLNGCKCYRCIEYVYCVIGSEIYLKSIGHKNPIFCGPPPPTSPSFANFDEAKISIEAVMYQMRKDSIVGDSMIFALPKGTHQKMMDDEFSRSVDSLIANNPNGYLEYFKINREDELKELNCENIICSNSEIVNSRNSSNNEINFNVFLTENPFSDETSILLQNNSSSISINLLSLDGKTIFQKDYFNTKKNETINLHVKFLDKGLYILSIKDLIQKKIVNKKIVKN